MADLEKVAAKVVEDLKAVAGKIKGIHGGFSGIKAAAPVVVEKVHEIGAELGLAGDEKKELAILVIDGLIPDVWWCPGWVQRILIGMAIDAAYKEFKKRTGK